MVVLSMLFMYFIMLPICIWFLIGFATSYPPVGEDNPGLVMQWIGQTVRKEQAVEPSPVATEQQLVIPIVPDDPPSPREGQMWIKSPQGHLRIHIAGQTRNFVPATGDRSLMRPLIDINEYISFVTLLALGNLVAFQMPVFIFILGWTGLVDPKLLSKYRRHCVFICFFLGMILTPADPLSMLVLAFPLWGLYELGMLAAGYVYPRREQTQ
jgi:Sec-independent protein secretion pathway component TatC